MLRVLCLDALCENREAYLYSPEEFWPLVSGRLDLHHLDHLGGSPEVRTCGGRKGSSRAHLLYSVLEAGLLNGGASGLIYGFIFAWVGSIMQVLTMAEMGSMYVHTIVIIVHSADLISLGFRLLAANIIGKAVRKLGTLPTIFTANVVTQGWPFSHLRVVPSF